MRIGAGFAVACRCVRVQWAAMDGVWQEASVGKRVEGFAELTGEPGRYADYHELLGVFSEGDGLVGNALVAGAEFSHDAANGATFERVLFRSCLFDHADFRTSTFRDVRFEGCRFIGTSMDRAWLNRVDFHDCSAPGLSLAQARLAGVSLRACDLSYANLSESSIDRLRCRDTRLREAALQRAKLKNVQLDACDLTRIDVFGTRLAGLDLSGCIFQAPVLSATYQELRGAVVAPEQAVDLARLLGIIVSGE